MDTASYPVYITLFQDIYSRLTKNQHVHCSSPDDWDWVPPKQFNAITKQNFIKTPPNGRLNENDMRLLVERMRIRSNKITETL